MDATPLRPDGPAPGRLLFYFERMKERGGGRWSLVVRDRPFRKPPPPGIERSPCFERFDEAWRARHDGSLDAQHTLPL